MNYKDKYKKYNPYTIAFYFFNIYRKIDYNMQIGTPGSATYAVTLSGIGQMMNVLPDNTSNQIMAQDVRNVVFTLYQDFTGLSQSVQQSIVSGSSSNVYYSNVNPTSIAVGGIPIGTTFSNQSIQQIFDNMFYPYVAPILSISGSPSLIEYGNSSQKVNISFSVVSKKNNCTSVVVSYVSGSHSFGPYLSNTTNSGVVNNITPSLNTTTNLTLSLSDYNSSNGTGGPYSSSSTIVWSNRRYYGTVDLTLYGSPDLTSTPSATSSIYSAFTDALILGLSGAGGGSGSDLNNSRIQTRTMTGNGSYLVFAWPTSYNPGVPNFYTGSTLPNTAFTKIRSNSPFVNSYGYTTNYDVWITNTRYYTSTSINII